MDISKNGIMAINRNDKFLLYYDVSWDCWFFPHFDLNNHLGNTYFEHIDDYLKEALGTDKFEVKYIGQTIYNKYCIPKGYGRMYEDYIYDIKLNEDIEINTARFKWFSRDDMLENKRIQEVNQELVEYVLENIEYKGETDI